VAEGETVTAVPVNWELTVTVAAEVLVWVTGVAALSVTEAQ
jgi:hypothetical protein